VEIREK